MSMPNSDRADMNDIIDHLNAQLDADEQAAGSGLGWEADPTDRYHVRVRPAEDAKGKTALVAMVVGGDTEHIARHDPARVLREAAVLRQVINDYRVADRACMGADAGDPSYATIRAGRDAFKSVLQAYAKATG